MDDLDTIKVSQSQVREIISMLADEFDLSEKDDDNQKETKDEHFDGDTNSSETPNYDGKIASPDEDVDEPIQNEFMIDHTDLMFDTPQDQLEKYNDLVSFIDKAISFGANALDLSKRGLKKLPKNLLLLENLQYLYLEGNQLTCLPKKFFIDFPNLKWLDLRNNLLTELPFEGLDRHENLRYLLVENNQLKRLPCELGAFRNLSALNLDNNPLEYPPPEIISKGLKSILEFLKDEYLKQTDNPAANNYFCNYYDESLATDDVWASDAEEDDGRRVTRSGRVVMSRSRSESQSLRARTEFFSAKKMNTAETRDPDMRERLQKAKDNANKLSKSMTKLLNKRNSLPPAQVNVFKNEELERAYQSGKLDHYKKKKEKIDSKLQKVKDAKLVGDFRDKLKIQQRKMMHKRLQKGVDYIEPVKKAPFDISEDYLMVLTKKEREWLDKRLEEARNRPLSPQTLIRIEEERRTRDHLLQDKIREYSVKLMQRRENKSDDAKYDRVQAARDIRELKEIQRELEARRMEIQFNLRAYTGGLVYRETAKLNKKARVANILK